MPTVVNSYRIASAFGASPRSVTITAVTSGNTVIVGFGLSDASQGGSVSVSDDQGNTYTQDLSFENANADGDRYFFRASNVTNAPTSVSCSFAGSNAAVTFVIFEVSGLANSSPVDATAVDTTNTASASPSKSITTTADNSMVIGWLAMANGVTFTADAGFSQLPDASTSTFASTAWDNDVGAAGSKTISGTLSASSNWRWGVVAYKAAATSTAAKPAMHYARLRTA